MIRLENGLLKFDMEDITLDKRTGLPKKISGHAFVDMAGFNPYTKKGDAVIDLLKLLPSQPIDEFYTNRGEIAEQIVKESYKKKYGEPSGYVTFNKKEVDYDNFKNTSQYFGGLIDGIFQNFIIVEVKSKNIKKKTEIEKEGCLYEQLQAEFYTVLSNLNNYNMCWVFFNDRLEDLIKNHQPLDHIDIKEVEIVQKSYEADYETMIPLMKGVLNYYVNCYNTLSIPFADISQKYRERLKKEKGLIFYG